MNTMYHAWPIFSMWLWRSFFSGSLIVLSIEENFWFLLLLSKLPLLVFMTSHCIQSLTMMILYNNAQYMKKFFAYYYSTYQDSFPILPPSSCCLYLIVSIRNVSVVPAFQLLYAFCAIQLLSVFLTSALRAVSNNQ